VNLRQYLASLTPVQEDRVLVRKLCPKFFATGDTIDSPGCLIGAVHGATKRHMTWLSPIGSACKEDANLGIGLRFNRLCAKYGVERTGAMIRNRILRNRAARALELTVVGTLFGYPIVENPALDTVKD